MAALAYLIYIAGAAAVWLQLHHYWAVLPDPIATSFDMHGKPAGWMIVQKVFAIYIALLAAVSISFVAAALLVRKMPRVFVPIPNRNDWLSPERRGETIRYMKEFYLWTGAFAALFIAGTAEFIFSANMKISPQIDPRVIYLLTGMLALGLMVVVLAIFWRFKKPAAKG